MMRHLFFFVNCYFTVVTIVAARRGRVLQLVLLLLESRCPCNGKMLDLGFTILIGGVLLGSRHLPVWVVTAAATTTPLIVLRNRFILFRIRYLMLLGRQVVHDRMMVTCLLILGSEDVALSQSCSRSNTILLMLLCLLIVQQVGLLEEGQAVDRFSLLYGLFWKLRLPF